MAHDADEPLPIPNSEQEYFNGVADDGSPLNIVSRFITPPFADNESRPPIGPHAPGASPDGAKSPFHVEADEKVLQAERDHIARVRKCVKLLEGTVDLGAIGRELLATQAEIELETRRRHLARLKAAPLDELVEGEGRGKGQLEGEGEGEEPEQDRPARGAVEPEQDTPDTGQANQRGIGVPPMRLHARPAHGLGKAEKALQAHGPGKAETALQTHGRDGHATQPDPTPREPRAPKFSAALLITLALRAAKELPKLSALLRDLEAKLRPAEAEQKLKQELYQDKAVSVVSDALNSMGEAYGQLGFGNWMPFRYADQWYMFCGIMNRVLAAHGLVPSGHAALYRKLLEETPSISLKAADAGPPKSWGLAYRAREHKHIQGIVARIRENRAGRGPPL